MSMNVMSSTTPVVKGSSSASGATVRPKKVEVRWLESESELYLKQWQHRYHQLVGIDNSYLKKSGRQLGADRMDDPFDDWCLSSKSLLDLDIDFDLNYPKNNNIIISNSCVEDNTGNNVQPSAKTTIAAFDHIFWSDDHSFNQKPKIKQKNKRLKPAFDENNSLSLSRSSSAVDDTEDIILNVDGYVIRQRTLRGLDTAEESEESAEDSFENIRIQPIKRFVQKTKTFGNDCNKKEIILSEKERQFSIDLNKRLELLAKDQALNDRNSETIKANKPKARARDRTRPARPRPPPIRRQIFKCEHIGCSYQSDRNFNFLRHKRTHRKNKADDEQQPSTTACVASGQPTAVLADISSAVKSTQTLVIINNNQISTQNSSQTLKLMTTTPQPNTTNNSSLATDPTLLTSVGHTFSNASLTTATDNTHISIASVVSPEELQAIKTSIDCLLKSCDTTDDNLKISINSHGITSSCDENHSYHQKVLFV